MAEERMLNDEILLGLIKANSGGGGGGTTDYDDLNNKPQINGVTLSGDKSASDLGLVASVDGKGLSTNDYTDADAAIVAGVTTALAGKQDTLTFDSVPTDGSTNPVESNGVYDALATKANASDVTTALALKQDKTDNTLQTTSKTVVGAVNELKSGLTTLDTEVNGDATTYPYADVITIEDAIPANVADCNVKIEPVQDLHGQSAPYVGGAGKNKLPLVLADIKAANIAGTWSGNDYTINDVTFTILTDSDGNVTGIRSNGTASNNILYFYVAKNIPVNSSVIFSTGNTYSWNINGKVCEVYDGTNVYAPSEVSGVEISAGTYDVRIAIGANTVLNNVDWYPMIRLATESDATFAPYTNICPISGHTEASVQRDGKNIFDVSTYPFTSGYYINALENGDYVGGGADFKCTASFVPCSAYKGMTLTLNKRPGGWRPGIAFYSDDSEANFISGVNNNNVDAGTPMTFTVPSNANYMRFTVSVDADNIQMELGQTATPYVPYAGKTYTIALGDTIYGGTVDFDSGVMTVTMAEIASYDGETIGEPWISDRDVYAPGTTPTTGAQVVYTLATPTTVQLTPQQIQLLKGTNTLTASTGNISVTVNGVSGAIGSVQEQVNDTDEALAELAADIADKLPTAPTTDGAYVLTVTVADGTPTYSWESAT